MSYDTPPPEDRYRIMLAGRPICPRCGTVEEVVVEHAFEVAADAGVLMQCGKCGGEYRAWMRNGDSFRTIPL